MTNLIETHVHRGVTIEIHYDDCRHDSPRDWENGTKMVLSHRRYDLANEIDFDFDEFENWGQAEVFIREHYEVKGFLWVHGYDHGALHLSAQTDRNLQDQWDSGIAGCIFMDAEDQKKMGTPDERINEVLAGDVEVYNQYLNGEVYGFMVKNPSDPEDSDSCWGFYGDYDGDVLDEARAVADWYADERDAEEAAALLPVLITV